MIVGWVPGSGGTFKSWFEGLAPNGSAEPRTDVNNLLRDLDVEIASRLVRGSMFDLKYLGSPTLQASSVCAPGRGLAYAVGPQGTPDIFRIDPFLGAVDTGLNATAISGMIGGAALAPGEAVFWTGSSAASSTVATHLHTGYTAVSNIASGAGTTNISPQDYRYSPTHARYYRTVSNAGVRTAQHATSIGGSWTSLASTSNTTHIDFNRTGYPYLAVVQTGGGSSIISRIFVDTTQATVAALSGGFVGTLSTYTVPIKCWFYQDRLYVLARDSGSTFWAVLRSGKSTGISTVANLVSFTAVLESAGAISGNVNPSSGQFITAFNSTSTTMYWSVDGLQWNFETLGGYGKIAGDRLYTPKSVSRFL